MFENCDIILNIQQVMETLDIGRTKLYRMLADGEIHAVKVGNKWRIPRESLEDYFSSRLSKKKISNKYTHTKKLKKN